MSLDYSDMEAISICYIESVKNPKSGTITADSVGEIVKEDPYNGMHRARHNTRLDIMQ